MNDRSDRHEKKLSPAQGILGLIRRRDLFDRIISLVFLLCLAVVLMQVFYKKFHFASHELTGNNVTGRLQHVTVNIKDTNGNFVIKDNEPVEGAIFTYGADYELTLSWEMEQTALEEQALGKGDYLLLTLGEGFFEYENTRLDHALMYRENQIGEWGIKNNKLQNVFRDAVKQFSKTEGRFYVKGTFCSKAVGSQAVTIAGVEIQNVMCNPKEDSFPAEKYVRVRYDSPIVTAGEAGDEASVIKWDVLVNAKYEADYYYAKMRKELLMGDASLSSVLLKEPLPEDLEIDTVDIQAWLYRPRSIRELSGVVTAKFSLTGQFHKVDQKTGQTEEDWINELKTYGRAYGVSADKKTLYVWVESISDLKLAADSEDFEDKLILGTIHKLTTEERKALAGIYGENGAYPARGFVVAVVSKPAGVGFEKESYQNTVYLMEKEREIAYDSKPIEVGIGKLTGRTDAFLSHEARLIIRDFHTQEPVVGAEVKLQYVTEEGEWRDYTKEGTVVTKTTDTEGVLLFDGLLPMVYRFVELGAGEGYDVNSVIFSEEQFVIGAEEKTKEITATNQVLGRNITVRQVWEDYQNEAGVRPSSIKLTLRADGEEYRTAVVTAEHVAVATDGILEENIWEYTFTELPVYGSGSKGEAIDYTVQAEMPEGYEQVVEGYTITDTLHLLHSVKLVKRDYNTGEPIGGAVFRLQVLSDGVWSDCISNEGVVDKTTDERGEVIFTELEAGCYRFVEVRAGVGYDPASAVYSVNPFVIYPTDVKEVVISATNRVSNMDILVTKVWRDSNNIAGVRPGFITLILMDGASEVRREILSQKNATSNPNIWEVLFKDLPVYFGDTSRRIDYTVREESVAHYDTMVEGFTVTDTLSPSHAAGLTATDHDTGMAIEGAGFKLQYQGVKGWEDYREQGIVAVKTTDSEGNLMFTALPTGKYRFVEVSARTGYNIETAEYSENTFVISETDSIQSDENQSLSDKNQSQSDEIQSLRKINVTNEVFKTDVTVRKVWEDFDDLYGVRPESVTMHLMKGTNETGVAVLTVNNAVVDEAGMRQMNIWEYTFENVPQYDGKTGEKISYTVRENKVDKYTQVTEGYTVTGSLDFIHTVHLTCADAASGERLSGVCFKLQYRDKNRWIDHQEDGTVAVRQTLADGTLQFERLPAGQYRFVEVTAKEGYDLNSAQYSENEFMITSSDAPTREIYVTNSLRDTSITVKKVWKDYQNAAGIRPQAVTISLKEGGKTVRTAVLTEENAVPRQDGTTDGSVWEYTFAELPVADAQTQEALAYTVESENVENYFRSINGYVITDTLQLEHAVVVRKSDYNTGAAVEGTVFKLQYLNETEWEDYTVNGSLVTKVTGEDGSLVFTGLGEGTFRVVEMLAKEGYSVESAGYSQSTFVIQTEDIRAKQIRVTNRLEDLDNTVIGNWQSGSNTAGHPAVVSAVLDGSLSGKVSAVWSEMSERTKTNRLVIESMGEEQSRLPENEKKEGERNDSIRKDEGNNVGGSTGKNADSNAQEGTKKGDGNVSQRTEKGSDNMDGSAETGAGNLSDSSEKEAEEKLVTTTGDGKPPLNLTLGTGGRGQNSEGYLSYEEYLNNLRDDSVDYNGGSRLVNVISKEQPSGREPVKKKSAKADKFVGGLLIVLAVVFGFEVLYGIVKGKDV